MATLSSPRRPLRQSPPVESSPWSIQAAALTDRGQVRSGNEDSVYLEPSGSLEARARGTLCVVADGMGGYAAGEVASRLAVQGIRNRYYAGPSTVITDALRSAMETTNLEIWQQAQRQADLNGMGCTVTAAVLLGSEVVIGHVGDSRAYLVRNNGIAQLTRDHTWVGEQVESGALTREQANRHPQRNVILRALGARQTVSVDVFQEKMEDGDVIVLCSDGHSTVVSDEEIGRTALDVSPEVAVRQLVALTNQRGAPDNVTVAVLRVQGPRPSRVARMRRWWPVLVAGVALLAIGGAIAFANRGAEPASQALPTTGVVSPPASTAAAATPVRTAVVTGVAPASTRPADTTTPAALPTPRAAHIGGDRVNLRQSADQNSPTVGQLEPNASVSVVNSMIGVPPKGETDPTWYEVTTSGSARGWVYARLLTFDGASSSTPAAQPTPPLTPVSTRPAPTGPTVPAAPAKPRP